MKRLASLLTLVAFACFGQTRPTAAKPGKSGPSAGVLAKVVAEAKLAREADDVDKAIALYRQGTRLNPKWDEGWWFLGSLHYEKDQHGECRDALRRFVSLKPKAGPGWAMLGLCQFQTAEYGDSFRSIIRAQELGLPEGQLLRVTQFHEGLLLLKLENYERALFLFTFLVKDGQDDPNAVAAAGIAALRRSLFPKEIPEADRPLVLAMGRAVALAAQRRPAEAKKAFEEVLQLYPNVANAHYTYAAFLLGQDADAAVREWKKELEMQPEHLPSLVSLALEYLKRGDIPSAKAFSERALKAAPDHFTAHAAMGRTLLDGGDHLAAIPHLELAAKQAPDSLQVRLALATAYGRAGRTADAARERAAFTALKKSKPE